MDHALCEERVGEHVGEQRAAVGPRGKLSTQPRGAADDADRDNREAIAAERARYTLPREHVELTAKERERMEAMSRSELFANAGAFKTQLTTE